ncbi:Zn-ribbon domain-containing OB-fold protein [Halomarina salina]|uniref:Zn-ribbon domain-containing OB-fold protein n=1 Tax=Halomarina salina TaxID=1872699 RepID=A0ABD5RTR7_9EURY|nr:zinc ribbon domain-containing protein [Halomarina salina]
MREGALAAPFFEALADGEFAVQRCSACSEAFLPPSPVCPVCHADDVGWERTDATGTLHAFTELTRTPPGFDAPAVVGTVDLDVGVRLLVRVSAAYDDLTIGERLVVEPSPAPGTLDRGRWSDYPFFSATLPDESASPR